MTGDENPDPLGEYVRVCPYCGDQFTAGHMNREFCPEKNGFKDYCKNRYKRIVKEEIVNQQSLENEPVVESSNKDEVALPLNNTEETTKSQLQTNICLMAAAIGNSQTIKLPKYHLVEKGVVYEANDGKHQLPGSELHVLTFGPYAVAWGYLNHILLTLKKNIKWIQ